MEQNMEITAKLEVHGVCVGGVWDPHPSAFNHSRC